MDNVPQTNNQQSQPLKPQAQAQLNKIDKIETQAVRNSPPGHNINKAVGSNILQSLTSRNRPPQDQADGPKKRRRGKRGGKKNRQNSLNSQPAVIAPADNLRGDQVIKLR
jgi:hypothetical protein